MDLIEQAGYEVYFVGGCVRDTILGRPIHDIDLASSARPEEIEGLFHHTIDLGKEHGTIIVIYQGQNFEITTFRTEGNYSDFRRPDSVAFVRNLAEDTLRRDFTINALAFNRHGELFDYHQGLQDLKNHKIRAVGLASERFNEDALRMLRAIRFSSELGFDIDPLTFEAISQQKEKLAYLSRERIRVEFTKFLRGAYFYQRAQTIVESGLWDYLPKIKYVTQPKGMDRLQKWLKPVNQQGDQVSESLIWALYTKAVGIETQHLATYLKAWTHSKQLIYDVIEIRQLLPKMIEHELGTMDLYLANHDLLLEIEAYLTYHYPKQNYHIAERIKQLAIQNRQEMAINGHDIMTILQLTKGGPMIGQLMAEIERKILHHELENTYPALEAYIRTKGPMR